MDFRKILNNIKKAWDWIWNSDSFLSWIIALILIFTFVKFVFFPVLSLIMGTSLPLAGIESSSMDHQISKDDSGRLSLCGNGYTKKEKHYISFDDYWEKCGSWYEEKNISKEEFSDFSLKDGFRKGDIIIVYGRFKPKTGDIIIFKPNIESTAPRPIIHRIVNIEGERIETKGDHNANQLVGSNNFYYTDETNIKESQIVGKAIFKIPFLGWPKIWLIELLKLFFG